MDEGREKGVFCAGIRVAGIIFLILGILPGSVLGGALGLRVSGSLFGLPVGSELVPRLIVLVSMIVGLLLSAFAVMFLSSLAGRIVGCLLKRPTLPCFAALEKDEMKKVRNQS
jgi:hypothetical protein